MENPPLANTYINEASKLNGENYVNWKFKMMTMLESANAWSIGTDDELGPVSAALLPNWNKQELKEKLTLQMSIKDYIISHIINCTTSKETWDTFKGLYQTTDANWVLFLKTKLLSIKMEANEWVRKFISRIKELSDKLGDIGEIVESFDLVTVTLKGLVSDYKVFISALEVREKPPNFEELTLILI